MIRFREILTKDRSANRHMRLLLPEPGKRDEQYMYLLRSTGSEKQRIWQIIIGIDSSKQWNRTSLCKQYTLLTNFRLKIWTHSRDSKLVSQCKQRPIMIMNNDHSMIIYIPGNNSREISWFLFHSNEHETRVLQAVCGFNRACRVLGNSKYHVTQFRESGSIESHKFPFCYKKGKLRNIFIAEKLKREKKRFSLNPVYSTGNPGNLSCIWVGSHKNRIMSCL